MCVASSLSTVKCRCEQMGNGIVAFGIDWQTLLWRSILHISISVSQFRLYLWNNGRSSCMSVQSDTGFLA